jgi:hypothetical protein
MKYALEVGGDTEKHLLEYQFDEFWGKTVIKIDNEEISRSKRWFSPSNQQHELDLGKNENIRVRIEREPKFPFGERSRVFVNERLVRCF